MEQNAKHLSVSPTAGELGVPGVDILGTGPAFDRCDEISLGQLSAFDRIVITTRNHTYEVVVTSPDTGEVLVRGGTVFPRFTAARLNGSSAGDSSIKARSVNVGVRVEFAIEGYVPVVTTRVQTLAVAHC